MTEAGHELVKSEIRCLSDSLACSILLYSYGVRAGMPHSHAGLSGPSGVAIHVLCSYASSFGQLLFKKIFSSTALIIIGINYDYSERLQ